MGEEGVKVTGIRQIVRFREMLQKWHSMALGPKENESKASGIPPAVDKRLRNACISCDSDEEGCRSPEPPPDVPKGCIPIYVGPEHRRFVVPTSYLSHPAFKLLLEKAEEEFGFEHGGAITVPCEIETFKYILQCMKQHQRGLINGKEILQG
ncbi:protein SMALL AUXIN UP-REGULATED RNA 10-like [Phoenix dactylifera]|uniref:Protein SMALL AUXIN UP-REGULATED RNA 10-like n=1 Tax=Phoenix dactylifera TaxID=42345 RepID=A0A8B7BSJ4_PHODC|nr:protein SMALL AUXIN UP-REGULATED RNA 10-like [Phoenix dactylifera]